MKIERTYIISLAERLTDRLIPLIDYLKSIDLNYSVVPAIRNVDGKKGLILTIEKLFTEILNSEGNIFLILEDDADFIINGFKEKVELYMNQLPENWQCFYLGVNLFESNVELIAPNLIRLKSGYTTHAIIYNRSAVETVLQAIKTYKDCNIPLDEILVKYVQPTGNCYSSYPMLISQKNGWSDIEWKEINYDKFLINRFHEKTAHLK